jgi:hypothetical protein
MVDTSKHAIEDLVSIKYLISRQFERLLDCQGPCFMKLVSSEYGIVCSRTKATELVMSHKYDYTFSWAATAKHATRQQRLLGNSFVNTQQYRSYLNETNALNKRRTVGSGVFSAVLAK